VIFFLQGNELSKDNLISDQSISHKTGSILFDVGDLSPASFFALEKTP
jgi:hypothetical protein